jgi:endonuclease YncB( thermonuclease family)
MSESEKPRLGDSFVPGWPKALDCPWGPYRAKVVEVHDGDTMTLEVVAFFEDRKEVQVRLYGVNAPEMSTTEGVAARDFLRDLLPPGTPVRFTPLLNEAGQAMRSFTRYVGAVEFAEPAQSTGAMVVMGVADVMVLCDHAKWCDRNLKPLPGPPEKIRRWIEPA